MSRYVSIIIIPESIKSPRTSHDCPPLPGHAGPQRLPGLTHWVKVTFAKIVRKNERRRGLLVLLGVGHEVDLLIYVR